MGKKKSNKNKKIEEEEENTDDEIVEPDDGDENDDEIINDDDLDIDSISEEEFNEILSSEDDDEIIDDDDEPVVEIMFTQVKAKFDVKSLVKKLKTLSIYDYIMLMTVPDSKTVKIFAITKDHVVTTFTSVEAVEKITDENEAFIPIHNYSDDFIDYLSAHKRSDNVDIEYDMKDIMLTSESGTSYYTPEIHAKFHRAMNMSMKCNSNIRSEIKEVIENKEKLMKMTSFAYHFGDESFEYEGHFDIDKDAFMEYVNIAKRVKSKVHILIIDEKSVKYRYLKEAKHKKMRKGIKNILETTYVKSDGEYEFVFDDKLVKLLEDFDGDKIRFIFYANSYPVFFTNETFSYTTMIVPIGS